MQELMTNMN